MRLVFLGSFPLSGSVCGRATACAYNGGGSTGAKIGRHKRVDMTACFGSSIRLYWLNLFMYLWLNLIEM